MTEMKELNDNFDWFSNQSLTKGQETKLKIIRSALRLFSQVGFANVTLQDIGAVASASHPLILKHFGSKNNLLLAVRKYVSASNHNWVDPKVTSDMNARECIVTHGLENLKWSIAHPDEAKIILLTYYHSSLKSKKDTPGERARNLGIKRILKYVQQAEREKLIIIDENPIFIAEMIHEYFSGLFVKLVISGPGMHKTLPAVYKRKIELFLQSFLKVPAKTR